MTYVLTRVKNHYYPFGLKHTGYNSDEQMYAKDGSLIRIRPVPPLFTTSYDYKYNGKELQEELGLNMYDYGARNYDPALDRWMNMVPLAEQYKKWLFLELLLNTTNNDPLLITTFLIFPPTKKSFLLIGILKFKEDLSSITIESFDF